MKTIIIGNSGSGKTWLATRLADHANARVVHLDHLFWQEGGFDRKRTQEEVDALIFGTKCVDRWIVEGVFGELAQRYLNDADCLIWLDIPWGMCKVRLEQRSSVSKKHLGRAQSEEGLRRLTEWAATYDRRTDLCSYLGHKGLFESFIGQRFHLTSEASAQIFLIEALATSPSNEHSEK
ncbi:AAA family ATPase [Herbaspirillum sp. ST 5-3]|uniref:AAA family ATPase n=1 Tax=Oxalobacteraceae TaxID=75682 RepID=UPI0010A33AAD|nr:AAA family ATPase [Herbaspirillum sp. ST 5-3]